MTRWASIAVAALVVFAAGDALAQGGAVGPTDPRIGPGPVHRVSFPDISHIGSAAFSPDGQSIFVHVSDLAINLWELLVYYWPEILGATAAIAALVCAIAMRRILRSKRLVGHPHCRNCNYCLTGCESGRCPECGKQATKPIDGRSTRRRLMPFTVPAILLIVFYGSLHTLRVPRTGYVSDWLHWWSYDLADWAEQNNAFFGGRWSRFVSRIVKIDAVSGEVERTLITWRGMSLLPITLTPDGAYLLHPLGDAEQMSLINTGSGRVADELEFGDWPHSPVGRWDQIAGFNSEGDTAYLVALDRKGRKTHLVAWNWKLDQVTELLTSAADTQTTRRGQMALAREYRHIPTTEPPLFLDMPASYRLGGDIQVVFVRDPRAPKPAVASFFTTLWGFFDTQFSPDAKSVFVLRREQVEPLAEYDLAAGKLISVVPEPRDHEYGYGETDRSRRRLVVTGHWHEAPEDVSPRAGDDRPGAPVFLVRDLVERCWIGRYACPPKWIQNGLCVTPDGSAFAVWGCERGKWEGSEVLIYSLNELPHAVDLSSAEDPQD